MIYTFKSHYFLPSFIDPVEWFIACCQCVLLFVIAMIGLAQRPMLTFSVIPWFIWNFWPLFRQVVQLCNIWPPGQKNHKKRLAQQRESYHDNLASHLSHLSNSPSHITVIIGQILHASVFTFISKILQSFISSHLTLWFCHTSRKTSNPCNKKHTQQGMKKIFDIMDFTEGRSLLPWLGWAPACSNSAVILGSTG